MIMLTVPSLYRVSAEEAQLLALRHRSLMFLNLLPLGYDYVVTKSTVTALLFLTVIKPIAQRRPRDKKENSNL